MNYNENQNQHTNKKDAPRRKPHDKNPIDRLMSSMPFVILLPLALIFLEVVVHFAAFKEMDSSFFVYATFFSLSSGLIMAILCTLFGKKINYIINQNDDCEAHFHSNIEIIHLVSGCLDVTIRGEKRRLFPGDMAIASCYEPHSFCTVGSSEVHVFLFPADMVPDFTTLMKDNMPASPFWEHSARTEEVIAAMEHLKTYTDRDITLAAVGYMYAVLGVFVEELGLCRKPENKQSELLLQKLLVYIEDHFREPLILAEMAHEFGYHKDYLSKIFNACIGCGFNRYVNVLRARYARKLIMQGNKSLDEIATASGFQCMKSFRRAFYEYYGQTPYEYRRELGQDK